MRTFYLALGVTVIAIASDILPDALYKGLFDGILLLILWEIVTSMKDVSKSSKDLLTATQEWVAIVKAARNRNQA